MLITYKLGRAFVNSISRLMSGSNKSGTLNRALSKPPKSWISLLPLSLSQRVMNHQLVVAVTDMAAASQGSISPVSRYKYAFVRCLAAASVA